MKLFTDWKKRPLTIKLLLIFLLGSLAIPLLFLIIALPQEISKGPLNDWAIFIVFAIILYLGLLSLITFPLIFLIINRKKSAKIYITLFVLILGISKIFGPFFPFINPFLEGIALLLSLLPIMWDRMQASVTIFFQIVFASLLYYLWFSKESKEYFTNP